MTEKSIKTPVSVVVRRRRGVTRWAPWVWSVAGVLPQAAEAPRRTLREDEEGCDLLLGAPELELHRTDIPAYRYAMSAKPPGVWVVVALGDEDAPSVRLVTASPHEAEAYLQSGEELVEQVPAPEPLIGWIQAFIERHPTEEVFKKRKRDAKAPKDRPDGEGLGDARIRQARDVYRAPQTAGRGAGGEVSGEDADE